MSTKFYKNEKFQSVFFPLLYFALTIAIVVTACFIFKKKYYQPIVVDGSSMQPTLVGGTSASSPGYKYRYHYGAADLNRNSINGLKRFDVIVTYYPSSWISEATKSYKIKRVWGFPSETIHLSFDDETRRYTFSVSKPYDGHPVNLTSSPIQTITRTYEVEKTVDDKRQISTLETTFTAAEFTISNKSFFVNFAEGHKRTIDGYTLGKNEYFVMGDNWCGSTDSYANYGKSDKLTKSYLQGKVLYISAYVSLKNDNPVDFHEFKKRYFF